MEVEKPSVSRQEEKWNLIKLYKQIYYFFYLINLCTHIIIHKHNLGEIKGKCWTI